MRNTNKKGFTIVELVIVIAVIAILAAVLIPTVSGIIAQANLSNDKSFVRNMNVTLAAEGAVNPFKTAGDAIDALNRNGFEGKYNTYSKNHHYCYSFEKNTMYLLDENNKPVYPDKNVDVSTLWGLYMDNRSSVTAGVTKYVAMTNIRNSAHYAEVFESGTYTIDLNDHMLAVDTDLTNVTANNGVVIKGATAGEGVNEDVVLVEPAVPSDPKINDLAEISNYYKSEGTPKDGVLTISDKIITETVYLYVSEDIVFEDCIFYGGGIQIDDASGYNGYKVTFNNCQFTDMNKCAILAHGSIEVNSCTFTNTSKYAIQVQENSQNITVKITGSSFDGVSGQEYPIIRFVGKNNEHCPYETTNVASLEISGCTFTALNKATGILGFSGTGSALYGYTGAEGQTSITFSNNKFGEKINGQYLVGGASGNTLGTLLGQSAK